MISRRLQTVLLGSAVILAGSWACGSGKATSAGTGGAASTVSTTVVTVATGAGGGGTGGAGIGNLGLACAQDSDCGAPLTCILPTATDPVFGGGPAAGYCSKACATGADCPGAASTCLLPSTGTMGDCVATCTLGPKLVDINDALDPNKCQGREDVRCLPINADATIDGCIPTCGSDSQCPAGEVCDPRNAVCVAAANESTGLPNGSQCDPTATTPPCAAECVSFGSATDAGPAITQCTNPCVLGGKDIATNPNCGGESKGLCAYFPTGNGAGDFGFCAAACSFQSDCQNPDFWCFPINGLTGSGAGMIPNGYCFGATPCPNGASDCTQSETVCTPSSGGPVCLSTLFPAMPGDGGTGDGGTGDGGTEDGGTEDGGGSTDGGSGGGSGEDGGSDGGSAEDGGTDGGGTDAG
jgi:hypothetical protein